MPKDPLVFRPNNRPSHPHVWVVYSLLVLLKGKTKKINTRDKKDQVKSARSLSSTPTELSSTSQEAW